MILLVRSDNGIPYLYDTGTNLILQTPPDFDPSGGDNSKELYQELIEDFGINQFNGVNIGIVENEQQITTKLENEVETLILSVTEACNNRCGYCIYSGLYHNERIHGTAMMQPQTVYAAIKLFAERSQSTRKRVISFYGGEPLLNWKAITSAVEIVSSLGLEIGFHITTNAIALDEERIHFLLNNHFTFSVSLDGPQSIHDAFRITKGGEPTWTKVMSALECIKRITPNDFAQMVILLATLAPPYPLRDIWKFYEQNELVSNNHVLINFIVPYDTSIIDDMTQNERSRIEKQFANEYRELRNDFVKAAIRGEFATHFGRFIFGNGLRSIHNRVMFPGLIDRPNGVCIPGSHRLYVGCDERLFPCEKCGDFMPIGTLSSGIDSVAVIRYLTEYGNRAHDRCQHCVAVRFCDLCYVNGKKEKNFNDDRMALNCRDKVAYIRDCFEIYVSVREQNETAFDSLIESSVQPNISYQ